MGACQREFCPLLLCLPRGLTPGSVWVFVHTARDVRGLTALCQLEPVRRHPRPHLYPLGDAEQGQSGRQVLTDALQERP